LPPAPSRSALDRLLAEAKKGNFHVVVFPSIDRAGRSVRDVIEIDRALRAAGVDTIFLREGVDTSTPTGELFRNIMASLAEFEGRVIYERLSKGKRRKASEGGYTGGWLPYGYRRAEDGSVQVMPEEAEVVKRIFDWAAEGTRLDRQTTPGRQHPNQERRQVEGLNDSGNATQYFVRARKSQIHLG